MNYPPGGGPALQGDIKTAPGQQVASPTGAPLANNQNHSGSQSSGLAIAALRAAVADPNNVNPQQVIQAAQAYQQALQQGGGTNQPSQQPGQTNRVLNWTPGGLVPAKLTNPTPMPTAVNIPNVGTVNFPDGMPDDQIHAEASKLAMGAQPVVAPVAQPSMLGQLGQSFMQAPANAMSALNTGATGVANAVPALMNQFRSPTNQIPMLQPNQSIAPGLGDLLGTILKNATSLDSVGFPTGHPNAVGQGVGDAVQNTAKQFTTPGNVALAPLAGEGAVLARLLRRCCSRYLLDS